MGHCEPNESSFTHTTCWTASWYSGLLDWWTYGHYKRQFMHHNSGCTAVITKVSFWEKPAFENMLVLLYLMFWIDIFHSFLYHKMWFYRHFTFKKKKEIAIAQAIFLHWNQPTITCLQGHSQFNWNLAKVFPSCCQASHIYTNDVKTQTEPWREFNEGKLRQREEQHQHIIMNYPGCLCRL